MVIGIAGGLMMAGLLLGAISGSIWLLIGLSIAGLAVTAAAATIKLHKEQAAVNHKLAQYPPYGY